MSGATKGERIAVRVTARQKQVLTEAAELTGRSVSDLIVQSAYERAEQVLADRRTFHVPADRWDEFLELLDRPAPHPGAAELLNRPTVFVDDK